MAKWSADDAIVTFVAVTFGRTGAYGPRTSRDPDGYPRDPETTRLHV